IAAGGLRFIILDHAGVRYMGLKTIAAPFARAARHTSTLILALFAIASLACAQSKSSTQPSPSESPNELQHHNITVADLPPPEVLKGPINSSRVIPKPEDAQLVLPPGFEISTYAEGDLKRPRWLALAANGDVFVAESEGDRLSVLRDTNGDGKVDER